MTEGINLKEIERKAWTSYFEDGLWEFFFGALFLIGGIRSLTNNVSYTFLLLVPILILPIGKKLITIPRLGHVKFGPARKLKQTKVFAILIISVLAMLALLLFPRSGLALQELPISPIMAVWIAVVFGLIAYYMDFRRLFVYGLLYALTEVLWGQFGEPIGPVVQTISGIVILLVGVAVFMRFVRRYPLPSEATLNVQG
jgi:hypothetical protein